MCANICIFCGNICQLYGNMSILYICVYKIQNMDICVAVYNIYILCVYTYTNRHILAHLSSECECWPSLYVGQIIASRKGFCVCACACM